MVQRKVLWGRVLVVALAAFSAVGAGLVPDRSKPIPDVHVYDAIRMGDGMARLWVRHARNGEPTTIGLTFDEAALSGLPETDRKHCCDGPEFVLNIPDDAGVGIKHVGINWNPKGHEPAGIYDKPHFDFHFYYMTSQEREAIAATGDDETRACRAMPEPHVPAGYLRAPGAVARMGAHWFDPASPEFNGKPFTTTFLYGSYDGHLTFVEPMITRAFLESRPHFVQKLKLPRAYEKPGYYPTQYRVQYDASRREYTVALEELVKR